MAAYIPYQPYDRKVVYPVVQPRQNGIADLAKTLLNIFINNNFKQAPPELKENVVEDLVAKNRVEDFVAENRVEDFLAENRVEDFVAENRVEDFVAENRVKDLLAETSRNIRVDDSFKVPLSPGLSIDEAFASPEYNLEISRRKYNDMISTYQATDAFCVGKSYRISPIDLVTFAQENEDEQFEKDILPNLLQDNIAPNYKEKYSEEKPIETFNYTESYSKQINYGNDMLNRMDLNSSLFGAMKYNVNQLLNIEKSLFGTENTARSDNQSIDYKEEAVASVTLYGIQIELKSYREDELFWCKFKHNTTIYSHLLYNDDNQNTMSVSIPSHFATVSTDFKITVEIFYLKFNQGLKHLMKSNPSNGSYYGELNVEPLTEKILISKSTRCAIATIDYNSIMQSHHIDFEQFNPETSLSGKYKVLLKVTSLTNLPHLKGIVTIGALDEEKVVHSIANCVISQGFFRYSTYVKNESDTARQKEIAFVNVIGKVDDIYVDVIPKNCTLILKEFDEIENVTREYYLTFPNIFVLMKWQQVLNLNIDIFNRWKLTRISST